MARRISAELIEPNTKKILSDMAADILVGQKADRAQLLVSGALAIHGAGSPLAKTGAAIYATPLNAAGTPVLVTKGAADLPALSGTVSHGAFNVYCFFVDSGGTLTSAMGTEGATIGALVFPTFDPSKVCIGFVLINPTGTGNFVGGTTNLDDATVAPNAVYVNTLGAFNPTATQSVIS